MSIIPLTAYAGLKVHTDRTPWCMAADEICRQLNDGFHQIALDDIAADLRRAGACITREQGRSVLNNGHSAGAFLQLLHAVEHEQHLTIGDGRQARSKTAVITALGFRFHLSLFPFPVDAERRVC